MPRKPFARSVEAQALAELEEELQAAIDQIAAEHGPSMDADPVSDAEAVHLWGIRDPNVDGDQLLQALQAGGLDQETLGTLKVVKENSELAALYGPQQQPLPYEVALDLARLAEFPYRHGLYKDFLETDPKEAVEIAERIDRQYQKKVGESMPTTVYDDRAEGLGPEPSGEPMSGPAYPSAPMPDMPMMPADPSARMGGY